MRITVTREISSEYLAKLRGDLNLVKRLVWFAIGFSAGCAMSAAIFIARGLL